MKLWYTEWEMRDAQAEAVIIIQRLMRDIKIYVHGDVSIRMAWRYADRPVSAIPLSVWKIYGSKAIRTYYPEAELLVNGEVVLNELLDLLCIDILHLEMKVLIENGEQVS